MPNRRGYYTTAGTNWPTPAAKLPLKERGIGALPCHHDQLDASESGWNAVDLPTIIAIAERPGIDVSLVITSQ